MKYRGYLIDRTPPELTDSYYPWAYGIVGDGRGILGWAHTRAQAKQAVDRDIERRTMAPAHDPARCSQCAEAEYR